MAAGRSRLLALCHDKVALFRLSTPFFRAVLDLDEFIGLVSASPVLYKAFDSILSTAKDRRERTEHERLSTIFRHVPDGGFHNHHASPNSQRLRPSLFHLRSVHEVNRHLATTWWHTQPAVLPGAPSSPHKSQLIKRASLDDGSPSSNAHEDCAPGLLRSTSDALNE